MLSIRETRDSDMPEDVPNSAHRSRCLRFMNKKETAERGTWISCKRKPLDISIISHLYNNPIVDSFAYNLMFSK